MRLLFEDTKLMKTLGLKMLTKYRTLGEVDPPVTWQVPGAYFGRGYASS
jgi:5-formaminoimidazole-4-carboxamide-1-beta-D-ribofuranosyl 5'-monophosphate synthetase